MTEGVPGLRIRPEAGSEDLSALYASVFPEEDLLPLLRDMRGRADVMSLVALEGEGLSGHVAFTRCDVAGRSGIVALLGPLAVAPDRQRRGIGAALVRDGLKRLADEGVARVEVLGDPAYYGRFGFRADEAVSPPYPLPEAWRAAWQALPLRDVAPPLAGALEVPAPWRRPSLWAP